MIEIHFTSFLFAQRLSVKDVSEKTEITLQTIYNIKRRGTISLRLFKILEKFYPNLENYVKGDQT